MCLRNLEVLENGELEILVRLQPQKHECMPRLGSNGHGVPAQKQKDFRVDRILRHKDENGNRSYLVEFRGHRKPTWQDAKFCKGKCDGKIQEYVVSSQQNQLCAQHDAWEVETIPPVFTNISCVRPEVLTTT